MPYQNASDFETVKNFYLKDKLFKTQALHAGSCKK